MSGHNKWSQIKYKKGIKDARRGKLFSRLGKNITIAAKNGGNPLMNATLKMAIDQAKAANMPHDNIERAIKRGTGEIAGAEIEEMKIEAYGPGGIALLIKVITDNKNRSLSEIKGILQKHNAKMADSGSVAYLFSPKGEIKLAPMANQPVTKESLEELIIESGADDFTDLDNGFLIYTFAADLGKVKKFFEEKGIAIESVKLVLEAKELLEVTDIETAKKILSLLNELEEYEDVDDISTNFDIKEEMLKEIT
ncbi:MAG: YebC/PmpR family DNA-binding transcriptional regulator [Candidatus Berkelbacteria bacterium]|nr:YebC/PmpR family DNA-binding transcriptional regulator [Candidatus Berkelbacteria bacterium]